MKASRWSHGNATYLVVVVINLLSRSERQQLRGAELSVILLHPRVQEGWDLV
jgi:hypothetical protein